MDLRELLQELEIDYAPEGHHHGTQGWVNINCVQCSPSSGKFKCGIPLTGKVASCWSCGKMSLLSTLVEASGRGWKEVKALLDSFHGGAYLPQEWESKRGKLVLPKGLGPLLPAHKSYLEWRGLDPEKLERIWGLRGTGILGNLPWRIWIPCTLGGRVVSWTTRSISRLKGGLRYRNAGAGEEELPLKSLLLGEDFCLHTVVVCEGPLDAMAIGPGAVATCGMSYTMDQLGRIGRFPRRVICFDSEPEAQARALRMEYDLMTFKGETHRIELETGKDAASASEKELKRVRKTFLR